MSFKLKTILSSSESDYNFDMKEDPIHSILLLLLLSRRLLLIKHSALRSKNSMEILYIQYNVKHNFYPRLKNTLTYQSI